MKPIRLNINTKSQKYPIFIGSNLLNKIQKFIKKDLSQFEKCLLVVDKKVPNKNISQIKKSIQCKNIYILYFRANEKNKNQKSVDKILKILLDKNFSRSDCLIAIGGGITGDVVGFAASVFKRGLQFINVPTSLLAQVDSSIGGKTGINTTYGKNLVGSFYQPKLVIADCTFLQTLPKREIICGYAEILKHSLISNKIFFNFLRKNFIQIVSLKSPFIERAIYESCKIKKKIVEKDENEKNLRKNLNFGHTFAHAYEASLKYSKKLNHGEAVLLGIRSALKFSLNKKFLKKNEYMSIIDHYKKSKLPSNLKKYFYIKDINKIVNFMSKDKKNKTNKINLILLKKIGLTSIKEEFDKKFLINFLKNELND
tara:strand:- start:1031 stop:2137 length:1107 start_codon:yes stop_codon:yes gene_type:complete